jgi:hypothetical protein
MKSKFYPRRTFIADQIDNECPNKTSLYYQLPIQKVKLNKIDQINNNFLEIFRVI